MRVDKDDRYMSEPPKKNPAPLLKSPRLQGLQGLSKPKLIILALAILIILLLLSLIIFRSPHKNEVTTLTPPTVNGVQSTDNTNPLDNTSNAATTGSSDIGSNTQTGITSNTNGAPQGSSSSNNTQTLTPAPISRTPTETQYQESQMQERLEIPGDITDELSTNVKQKITSEVKPKATVTPTLPKATSSNASETVKPKTNSTSTHHTNSASLATPSKMADNHFAIQLNASSSEASLKAFAKQNQITGYQIYETKRNSKPWFVLIKGNYASSNEARDALKSLPNALQKNNPWIKSGATINKEKAAK